MFLMCLVLRAARHDRRMSVMYVCMYGKVESMPLPDKEIYTIDYDPTRVVTLAFSSNR
jgi:hypothetical protein